MTVEQTETANPVQIHPVVLWLSDSDGTAIAGPVAGLGRVNSKTMAADFAPEQDWSFHMPVGASQPCYVEIYNLTDVLLASRPIHLNVNEPTTLTLKAFAEPSAPRVHL